MFSKWKDFMSMTRHEAVGAVVVLLLLLAAVGAHVLVSHRADDTPQETSQTVEEWQRRCDSVSALKNEAQPAVKYRNKKDSTATHKKKGKTKRPAPKPKQPTQDRRLDPVPTF